MSEDEATSAEAEPDDAEAAAAEAATSPDSDAARAVSSASGTVLSKSAARGIDVQYLMEVTRSRPDGRPYGSPFWAGFAWTMFRLGFRLQFRTIEITGVEHVPREGGVLCAAWHTNGLLDPLLVAHSHPRHFVFGGRHDLITRPLVGWWGRRIGMLPVVRKAELIRGGCTEEEASLLNGRSLLSLATEIAKGSGGALFPEGTSHSESHLIRLRTGPMRTILAAREMAALHDMAPPALQPVGLHFRTRHLFRTDVWIEFAPPVPLPDAGFSDDDRAAMREGTWVEPPAEPVNALRDALREHLEPLTPQAPDHSTLRAWRLLAHLRALGKGERLTTWRSEVEATREVRGHLRGLAEEVDDQRVRVASEVLEDARTCAQLLDRQGLDGRDLTTEGRIVTESLGRRWVRAFPILFGLALLPLSLPAAGIQTVLGFVAGNRQDEGLDARATFQFLAGVLGSVLVWPPVSIIVLGGLVLLTWWPGIWPWDVLFWAGSAWWAVVLALVVDWMVVILLFVLVMEPTRWSFDAWMAMRRNLWRRRLVASDKGQRLEGTLGSILARLPDVGL